jgi:lipoprotein-releasing system permease protein
VYRLFLAVRYLRSRLVNLISIGGVMAGVAVLIVVVAIMDGFQARVRRVVRGSLSHIILTPKRDAEHLPNFADLEQRLLHEEPHIVALAPQFRLPIFYKYQTARRVAYGADGYTFHEMEAVGVDWEHERHVSDLEKNLLAAHDMQHPFFHEYAEEHELTTVLVSRTFAENFNLGAYDRNGKVVHPYGALRDDRTGERLSDPATVRKRCRELVGRRLPLIYGTMETSTAGDPTFTPDTLSALISGVFDGHDAVEDNQRLYMDIAAVRRMVNSRNEYLQVNVRLDDYRNAPAVQKSLVGRLGAEFVVETWEDQKADFLQAVNQEKVMLVVVLSFIVLLGGFIILATLTLTVVEKTRDIGIVTALGAARSGVLSVFLGNGLMIGVVGSLCGLGLGAWFTDNVDGVHELIKKVTGYDLFPPDIYHFRTIPTVWHWSTVLAIMGGSVLISFVAGLLPALRAARLDPVKALRYE